MESVVLKIGGKAAEDAGRLSQLCAELRHDPAHRRFLIVHGGGAEVTSVSRKLGIDAVFSNGIRQTSPQEMDIVEMVLAGKMNKHVVRLCRTCGLDAVGLCGSDGGLSSASLESGSPRPATSGGPTDATSAGAGKAGT